MNSPSSFEPQAAAEGGPSRVVRAQLHGDEVAERNDLPDAATRARQLRLFLDGHRLPAAGRAGLVDRMIELAIRDCAAEAARATAVLSRALRPGRR